MKKKAMHELGALGSPAQYDTPAKDEFSGKAEKVFSVVLLAGTRRSDDPVASLFDCAYKALVPMCGKPMIMHVVEALSLSQSVKRIVIVFDEVEMLYQACPSLADNNLDVPIDIVPCGKTICCSVAAAIEAAGADWPFLVTTADHALLTPAMVDQFCVEARHESSLSVGFVEKKYLDAEHPGSKRTYLPFRETQLSGANLFAFMDERALPVLDFWREIEAKRKKPWKLFKAFGYRNLLGLLFRRYTVDEAFQRASKVLGVKAGAVRLPFAEAAIDVDTPKDYYQVLQILEERSPTVATFDAALQGI